MERLAPGTCDLLISGKSISSMIDLALESEMKDSLKLTIDGLLKVRGLVVFRASPSEKAKLV